MKRIIFLSLMLISWHAQSTQIANCSAPKGHAYYHFQGLIKKNDSGWVVDGVTKGLYSVVQDDVGNIDLLFVDTRNKPISAKEDGAQIIILQKNEDAFKVLVHYGDVTELYTFFREKNGLNRFSYLASKAGDSVLVPKETLMIGDCSEIAFEKVRK